MGAILYFVSRNGRIVIALGVVFAAVSAAGAIGWITAPV